MINHLFFIPVSEDLEFGGKSFLKVNDLSCLIHSGLGGL